jgi:hypothetical protein
MMVCLVFIAFVLIWVLNFSEKVLWFIQPIEAIAGGWIDDERFGRAVGWNRGGDVAPVPRTHALVLGAGPKPINPRKETAKEWAAQVCVRPGG